MGGSVSSEPACYGSSLGSNISQKYKMANTLPAKNVFAALGNEL